MPAAVLLTHYYSNIIITASSTPVALHRSREIRIARRRAGDTPAGLVLAVLEV